MKKTVWTFGLIAGAILSGMMLLTIPFKDRIGFENAEVIGYTTMIAAFLLVFFGIKSFRDNQPGRSITFGRAFLVGILINLVASACYVATWEVIYHKLTPDFMEQYSAHEIEKAQAKGATAEEITAKRAQMQKFQELYKNPFINAAITFLEVFPVGLIVSLVSAGILRRRRRPTDSFAASAPATMSV